MLKTIGAMIMLATSVGVAAQDAGQDAMDAGVGVYRDCLVSETVKLGQGNEEQAPTVLEAAREACGAARGRLFVIAMRARPADNTTELSQGLERVAEESARGPAVLALMKARAAR